MLHFECQSHYQNVINHNKHLTQEQRYQIHALLARKYSPEHITGRLRYLGWEGVPSHERIYQYVYADKRAGGSLHTHLRCQKTYRKRGYTNQDRRGQLIDRVDIEQRPIITDNRERLGDFEGDTVIGKEHKGVLVTLVDRATRETKIKALPNRKADTVAEACIDLLSLEAPQSITFDNGKELAQHPKIATVLSTVVFFAKPYHSWERGTNENTNGLIRQFLPKSMPLDSISNEIVQAIEDNLNNRPRKILGYRTPLEVKSRFGCVALHT